MQISYAHLWSTETLADVDIVLRLPATAEADSDTDELVILRLPGHKAILSYSPYFMARR